VKQTEALRIPALLAARKPRLTVEEATIEGIRMLVILGNEFDSVIRYTRGGGADMPQLSSYPEVAESAAYVDERLARQRSSGRMNKTGEGVNWPRNWKLSEAKTAGKVWYTPGRQTEARPGVISTPSPIISIEKNTQRQTVGPAQGSWRWCAEDYLREIWWPQDKNLICSFSEFVTCEMLHNLCVLYRVARNIPGHGLSKYGRFVEILNGHRGTQMTKENAPSIIEQALSDLTQAYGRSFLSAISKAFWMIKQHPVAIYDSYAWKGLQRQGLSPGYRGYRAYYKAWFTFFESADTQTGLNDALRWLPESQFVQKLLQTGAMGATEFNAFTTSMLLRNRIVDRRLCYEGGVVGFK
jgi:hypothetical protein